jgi:allantoinase
MGAPGRFRYTDPVLNAGRGAVAEAGMICPFGTRDAPAFRRFICSPGFPGVSPGFPFTHRSMESSSMALDPQYPRDLAGYGRHPVHADWPGGARIAVQFVLNYEEGGENCVLHGDRASEQFLSEIVGAAAYPARHMSMESIYEYGSRAGVWRILREFEKRGLPLTVFGVGMAIERNPEVARAFVELGHEIACHGYRWVHYQDATPEMEAEHMSLGMAAIERVTGVRPLGWYTGRDSPNTRRLVAEYGGFLYDSDYYGDDLPFWMDVEVTGGKTTPQLIVPYTLDTNDMRFATPQGFNTADHFFAYLRDAFDVLYEEGAQAPKMLSVGMHCRLLGRPGRFRALQRFLDHIETYDRVWVTRRVDIARHWRERHPYRPQDDRRGAAA